MLTRNLTIYNNMKDDFRCTEIDNIYSRKNPLNLPNRKLPLGATSRTCLDTAAHIIVSAPCWGVRMRSLRTLFIVGSDFATPGVADHPKIIERCYSTHILLSKEKTEKGRT
jgi:hypothetical protein